MNFFGPLMFVCGAVGLLLAWAYVELIAPSMLGATACLYAVQTIGGLILFLYACGVTGVPRPRALVEVIGGPAVLGIMGAAVTWLMTTQMGDDRLWKLIMSVGVGELVFLGLVLLVGLSKEERSRLLSFLRATGVRLGVVVVGTTRRGLSRHP